MRDSTPHRWPARRFRFAARPDCGLPRTPTPEALRKRMALPLPHRPGGLTGGPTDGPLAPPELRAEAPGPDGVRHGLVAFYRDLIACGELDSPDRFARAERAMLDTIR